MALAIDSFSSFLTTHYEIEVVELEKTKAMLFS